jgi:4-hydroxy-tetrahydrodipicolinate synthase
MRTQRLSGLHGSICLQMTPIKNGRIDDDAFAFLCERQIERGTTALVPLGIYSEAAALDRPEQARAIKLAVEVARGRVPVIAGSGVNYTSIAVDLAQQAETLGADALLCAVPYYDQSNQEGLYRHFQAIQASVGLPVIVFDVPSHTQVTLAADTILRLAELPKIAGIADATGDVARAMVLRQCLGPDFLLLCGDVRRIAIFQSLGSQGSLSAAANIAPAIGAALHHAPSQERRAHVQQLAALFEVLDSALSIGGGPAPLRWALASLGLIEDERHLPPTWIAASQEALLRLALDTVVPVEAALVSERFLTLDSHPSDGPGESGGVIANRRDGRSSMDLSEQKKPEMSKIQGLISRAAFQLMKETQETQSTAV